MITTQRTMPESDFTPEASLDVASSDRATDELLDASELQTVLDMLAVMETAEELSQLQALTEAQKRQVWEATPEMLKQKLWRLRNSPAATEAAPAIASESLQENLQEDFQQTEPEFEIESFHLAESERAASAADTRLESEADREDEIEDLGQDLDLTESSYALIQSEIQSELGKANPNELSQNPATQHSELLYADRSIPRVGDRVVLKAHPKLTAAELKAVWQLERIQGSDGSVSEPTLGTRSYPLTWMRVYARTQLGQSVENSLDDFDSEEEF